MQSLLPGALAIVLVACGRPGGARTPPAVLLISIDTLRADHLGLYGYSRDTSPFLDRWSRDAIVFEHAFTPLAWTLVAHMTMLTGLFPVQHGVVEGDLALALELPFLAERLHAAGYQTVGLHQPGWIDERHGFARGFDVFRAHEGAAEAGQHLFEELGRLDARRPWFVFVHLFDVHCGRMPGEEPGIYSAPPPFHDYFLPGASRRLAGLKYNDLIKGKVVPTAEQIEALVALYDDGIRQVDAVLEQWFERLERQGFLGDTLVIVTSDHGEALGPTWTRATLEGLELPVYMHGGSWQEGLHVPLILRPPGSSGPGRRVTEPAHLVDVAPTILTAAGLSASGLPGRSLLGPLPPDRVLGGSSLYLEWVVRWPLKMGVIRDGTCLAVDLEKDPLERAVQHVSPERFHELRAGMGVGPGPLAPPTKRGAPSPEARAELEALGYGGEQEGG